jgi:hypothetical protein
MFDFSGINTKYLVALTIVVIIIIAICYKPILARIGYEPMCGGADQLCPCAGNETMVGGRVTDNTLTRINAGH